MPIMIVGLPLRKTAGGDLSGVRADAGDRLQVLDDSKLPWTKIKLLDDAGQPEGWVIDEAIDKASDQPTGLSRIQVARQAVRDAMMFGANAFYLMAVAQFRSKVTHDAAAAATGKGLFAFSATEWTANLKQPDFETTVVDDDIRSWRLQASIFAMIASTAGRQLVEATKVNYSMATLLLAQTIGIKAAATALKDPTAAMAPILEGLKPADLAAVGIDPANIAGRDKALLVGATVGDVVGTIGKALDLAFTEIKEDTRHEAEAFVKALNALVAANPAQTAAVNFAAPDIGAAKRPMAELVIRKFAEAGYRAPQQIAALANAIAESSLDPNAQNLNGERSFGLFQLNQNGGVGFGHDEAELRNPERNVEIMLEEIAKPYQKANRSAFASTTSVAKAVKIFVEGFERPGDPSGEVERRTKIAKTLPLS